MSFYSLSPYFLLTCPPRVHLPHPPLTPTNERQERSPPRLLGAHVTTYAAIHACPGLVSLSNDPLLPALPPAPIPSPGPRLDMWNGVDMMLAPAFRPLSRDRTHMVRCVPLSPITLTLTGSTVPSRDRCRCSGRLSPPQPPSAPALAVAPLSARQP